MTEEDDAASRCGYGSCSNPGTQSCGHMTDTKKYCTSHVKRAPSGEWFCLTHYDEHVGGG